MNDETRPEISEITEQTVFIARNDVLAFLRSLLTGALAGAAPWCLLFIPLSIGALLDGEILAGISALAFPIVIAGLIVLPSMVVVGLPVTALLASKGRECPRIYALFGACFGFLIPVSVLLAFEASSFAWHFDLLLWALNGMFAGAITAFSWGKYRKSLRERLEPPSSAPNPIHDLIY